MPGKYAGIPAYVEKVSRWDDRLEICSCFSMSNPARSNCTTQFSILIAQKSSPQRLAPGEKNRN